MAIEIPQKNLPDYVGKTLVAEDWFTVDQSRIDAFADVTMDHQYIHVDPERARDTAYGSTIAHGLLTLSLLPVLIENVTVKPVGAILCINYGFNRIRFPEVVKVNTDIRASCTLLGVQQRRPDRILLETDIVIELKTGTKPALIAESLAMWVTA